MTDKNRMRLLTALLAVGVVCQLLNIVQLRGLAQTTQDVTTLLGRQTTIMDTLASQGAATARAIEGQTFALDRLSPDPPPQGGEVLASTWKWRDPRTGACVGFTVTFPCGQLPPADCQTAFVAEVRATMANFPPDPTCPP